jgi:hypothetical protein
MTLSKKFDAAREGWPATRNVGRWPKQAGWHCESAINHDSGGAQRLSDTQFEDKFGMSPEEFHRLIEEILEDLAHEGLVYDTGRRRNGEIVYAASPELKSAIESEIWSSPRMSVRIESVKAEPGETKR